MEPRKPLFKTWYTTSAWDDGGRNAMKSPPPLLAPMSPRLPAPPSPSPSLPPPNTQPQLSSPARHAMPPHIPMPQMSARSSTSSTSSSSSSVSPLPGFATFLPGYRAKSNNGSGAGVTMVVSGKASSVGISPSLAGTTATGTVMMSASTPVSIQAVHTTTSAAPLYSPAASFYSPATSFYAPAKRSPPRVMSSAAAAPSGSQAWSVTQATSASGAVVAVPPRRSSSGSKCKAVYRPRSTPPLKGGRGGGGGSGGGRSGGTGGGGRSGGGGGRSGGGREGATSSEMDTVTSSSSQENSPGYFRPVGLVLTKTQSSATSAVPYPPAAVSRPEVGQHTYSGPGSSNNPGSSPFLYCPPPTHPHLPWASAATNYNTWTTPNNSCYGAWNCNNVLMDSKAHFSPYGRPMSDHNSSVVQPSYGMYPVSHVYPTGPVYKRRGGGRDSANGLGGGECGDVPYQGEMPPQTLYGSSQAPPLPLYNAREVVRGAQYVSVHNADTNDAAYPASNRDGALKSSSLSYAGSAGEGCISRGEGCITTTAGVVTVRADDSSLYMTSSAGTTSQTEHEFSLHDAKMQLAESPGLLTHPPPSPSFSSYSFLCAPSGGGGVGGVGGGVDDRLPTQPTPGDEVKPHPGLDMLSDVSILVESLTSQGSSSGHSRNSQCAPSSSCSSSSVVISGLDCELGDDSETALCLSNASYMCPVPPDPDSTITLPPSAQAMEAYNALLPEGDLEYTTMSTVSVLRSLCYAPLQPPPPQYTLMLPPKKSTKFTKGSTTAGPLSVQPSENNPQKPHAFPKSSSGQRATGRQAEKPAQQRKPRVKKEHKDGVASKTGNPGTKKRGRPPKVKEEKDKGAPAATSRHTQTVLKKAKGPTRKRAGKEPGSARRKIGAREEESVRIHPATQTPAEQTATAEEPSYSQNTSSTAVGVAATDSTATAPGLTGQGSGSSDLVTQVGPAGDSYAVCESKENEPGLAYISMAKSETVIVAFGDLETHAVNAPDGMPMVDYDDLCPKVHFDPLLIAEEEVTSTQPHDLVTLSSDTTDVSVDHSSKKAPRRRRVQPCTSCFSTASSDDQSQSFNCTGAPRPPKPKPGHSKRASTTTTTKPLRKKSAPKASCRRCKKSTNGSKFKTVCDACAGRPSSSSSQESGSGKGSRGKSGPCCEVCGRAYSSAGTLARHRRLFHPSLFIQDGEDGGGVVELPLTSPPLCRSTSSSVSFALSTTKSETPSPFSSFSPTKSLSAVLLSPPSPVAIPCLTTPPTPHNSPCPTPRFDCPLYPVNPPGSTKTLQPGYDDEEDGEDDDEDGHSCDESESGSSQTNRRRRLRKQLDKQDKEWQPPKKMKTECLSSSPDGQRDGVLTRRGSNLSATGHLPRPRVTNAKAARTVSKPKDTSRRHKRSAAARTASSTSCSSVRAGRSRLIKCPLNFRTKKRTRVNSTIPCPYCDHLFSVMSNLKRHTKNMHGDVNVFVCNVCCYKINMRRKLNSHMKIHANNFPFKCVDCLARFRSEDEILSHQDGHDINRFPCEDCDLVFYTEEHLGDHIAQYHVTLQLGD